MSGLFLLPSKSVAEHFRTAVRYNPHTSAYVAFCGGSVLGGIQMCAERKHAEMSVQGAAGSTPVGDGETVRRVCESHKYRQAQKSTS